MKITKAMGRACLEALEEHGEYYDGLAYCDAKEVRLALREIGYGETVSPFAADGWYSDCDWRQPATALAMCAAIAGVKPE